MPSTVPLGGSLVTCTSYITRMTLSLMFVLIVHAGEDKGRIWEGAGENDERTQGRTGADERKTSSIEGTLTLFLLLPEKISLPFRLNSNV